tara:strand:- start:297 stop:566 length:270 start_codon:yes stop_codon:yes gene_type:complete
MMPRYSYYCEACKQTSEIFHLIDDKPDECFLCLAKGSLVKLVSRPFISTNKQETNTTAQERVEGHIESARQELVDQRSELTKEDLINDN